MKIIFLSVLLVGIVSIIFYLSGCKAKQKQISENKEKNNEQKNNAKADTGIYKELRDMSFTAPFLKTDIVKKTKDTKKVFGVIMDWDLGEGVATLVCFETGDASIYLSSGGGTIGGIGHESVKKQAKDFVSLAQSYLEEANKIDSTPLPDKDCVRFYLLTSADKFVAQEKMSALDNKTSKWLPLFEKANMVIYELNVVTNKH